MTIGTRQIAEPTCSHHLTTRSEYYQWVGDKDDYSAAVLTGQQNEFACGIDTSTMWSEEADLAGNRSVPVASKAPPEKPGRCSQCNAHLDCVTGLLDGHTVSIGEGSMFGVGVEPTKIGAYCNRIGRRQSTVRIMLSCCRRPAWGTPLAASVVRRDH
ncbi:hypothetical protein [Nocardia alni]|uniref:hypothetical protein n=1 Tax=Nocardia alni TaxID=2815723 RepID=UPI001C221C65|nr:hypothetical protein [Nocardia alni]